MRLAKPSEPGSMMLAIRNLHALTDVRGYISFREQSIGKQLAVSRL
jgi:hypothetical protein